MSKQDYSSPWKKMGTSARAAMCGSKRKPEPRMVLPTRKELSAMKLPECDPYVRRFDDKFSEKGTSLPRRKSKK